MRRLIVWSFFFLLAACGERPRFPEDQTMPGPIEVTSEWQTLEFERPLAIHHGEGVQQLHFVVDNTIFGVHDIDEISQDRFFSLKRFDGTAVLPEVVLIASDGAELPLMAVSNIGLYSGGMTIGFGLPHDIWSPSPPFPDNVAAIQSVRFRSDVPLVVERLMWMVRHHPDIHRCGGKCRWWEQWLR